MNDLKRQIYDLIKRPHLTSLATITEDGKPWVRYMSAVGGENFTIRMSTFVSSRKVQQIKNDPEVHLTCGCSGLDDSNSYLQIQGLAELSTSENERRAFWNDNLKAYFESPDNPAYGIIIVRPYRIELWGTAPKPLVWEA